MRQACVKVQSRVLWIIRGYSVRWDRSLRAKGIESGQIGNQRAERDRHLARAQHFDYLGHIALVMGLGLPMCLVLQVDLTLHQVDTEGLGGCGGTQCSRDVVQQTVEQVVNLGPLQKHLQLDEVPVATQAHKRSRGSVRPHELVVASVDQDQIRLVLDHLLDKFAHDEGIDGRDAAVDDLDLVRWIRIGEHLLQEVGKRGIGGIGEAEQGRSSQREHAKCARFFVARKAILPRSQAHVLAGKEAPRSLRIDAVGRVASHKKGVVRPNTDQP